MEEGEKKKKALVKETKMRQREEMSVTLRKSSKLRGQ